MAGASVFMCDGRRILQYAVLMWWVCLPICSFSYRLIALVGVRMGSLFQGHIQYSIKH